MSLSVVLFKRDTAVAAPAKKITPLVVVDAEENLERRAAAKLADPSNTFAGENDRRSRPNSPVLDLMSQLDASLLEHAPPPHVEKWSARRSMALTVGVSVALWAGIIVGIHAALR